jgi:lactate dehydrogenase-like 2-hydroxyacid dehydrogenase
MKIAILDDYQNVALKMAGWSAVARLPNLKLIASTGARNASIDMAAAKELGITVTGTGYKSASTIELTSALILASVRPTHTRPL